MLLGLLIFTCEKQERSDLELTDTTAVVDSSQTGLVLPTDILEKAPAWFKSIPTNKGLVYAVGTAKSRRGNIASDKAILNAQVKLAEKLKEMGLGSNTKMGETPLGADSDPSNNNLSITMQNVMIKNKKQIKSGDLWYSFVLLEMKLDN